MLKAISATVVLFALMTSSVFASKSRTRALGEERGFGSYFIDDFRNIFYNPALINDYNNVIGFEYGVDSRNSQDDSNNARAEGGYIAKTNGLNYGVWLGRESNTANRLRFLENSPAQGLLPGEDNKFEFFIGGDAGLKWGARIDYSSSEDEATNEESKSSSASFGVITGKTQFFGTVSLLNNAEIGTGASNAEFDGKLGASLGMIHDFSNYTGYLELQYISFDTNFAGGAISVGSKITNGRVGIAKKQSLNERAIVYSSVEIDYNIIDTDGSAKSKALDLPLTVGLEYEAKKWLTFRASVAQSVFSMIDDGTNDSKKNDTTTVGTGVGINYDGFVIDAFMGATSTDSLATKASLTYMF